VRLEAGRRAVAVGGAVRLVVGLRLL